MIQMVHTLRECVLHQFQLCGWLWLFQFHRGVVFCGVVSRSVVFHGHMWLFRSRKALEKWCFYLIFRIRVSIFRSTSNYGYGQTPYASTLSDRM